MFALQALGHDMSAVGSSMSAFASTGSGTRNVGSSSHRTRREEDDEGARAILFQPLHILILPLGSSRRMRTGWETSSNNGMLQACVVLVATWSKGGEEQGEPSENWAKERWKDSVSLFSLSLTLLQFRKECFSLP